VGNLIARRDPYFEFPASWWFVHMMLATRDSSVFGWFFNDFQERNFDRLDCVDAYQRFLRDRATKPPSAEMAHRDVACFLASYSDEFGKLQDAEDGTVCPLTDFGLLVHHRDTRRFEKISPKAESRGARAPRKVRERLGSRGQTVLFLAGPESDFFYGQTIPFAGGWTV
jgi:hypothetical protein